MVRLHPDSPLKCVECGNKQISVTFCRNRQSAIFEQWYLLVSAIDCASLPSILVPPYSALGRMTTRMERFGSEYGIRANHHETTLSNHRTTCQARHSRSLLPRTEPRDYSVRLFTVARSHRLCAPVNFARVTAASVLVVLATLTLLSPRS
jgi:hypothetical protein